MNSPKGISLIENNRLVAVNENLKVLDMVESSQHNLWFSGIDGIIRIALSDLKKSVTDRDAPLDYARFDRADGMNSIQCSVGAPNMAITPDDKLWVANSKGPGHARPRSIAAGEHQADGPLWERSQLEKTRNSLAAS